eukprot:1685715-Prymnesium_polylepis.1
MKLNCGRSSSSAIHCAAAHDTVCIPAAPAPLRASRRCFSPSPTEWAVPVLLLPCLLYGEWPRLRRPGEGN